MRHFRLIKKDIDIAPLVEEIRAHEACWALNTSRQKKIKVQRETENIFLRTADVPSPEIDPRDTHPSRLTPVAAEFPQAMRWLESFAEETGGELCRATLVRLAPGGMVHPHIDGGDYYKIRDRYHLVLISKEGSFMQSGGETVRMQEGELWWFDNKALHEAHNESAEGRVHLIFDLLPASRRGRDVDRLVAQANLGVLGE